MAGATGAGHVGGGAAGRGGGAEQAARLDPRRYAGQVASCATPTRLERDADWTWTTASSRMCSESAAPGKLILTGSNLPPPAPPSVAVPPGASTRTVRGWASLCAAAGARSRPGPGGRTAHRFAQEIKFERYEHVPSHSALRYPALPELSAHPS